MLDRHHLMIIRGIAEYGSLTQTAEHLHLTQSALTHSMKKLEGHLGVAIWSKQGRNIELTQSGRQLLSLANRVLPQFEHMEALAKQIAAGNQGSLRIGMECHPCYQWLLKVVEPYLQAWPDVEVDVKQRFQFGGMAALYSHDIDVLVTPDPLEREGVTFQPVFDYEQVLVVAADHDLASKDYVDPDDLLDQVLISYPVVIDRLDIYSEFLIPAQVRPKQHKKIETTDIMLQMVAAQRGVAALPKWLVEDVYSHFNLRCIRIGKKGIDKRIHLGVREADTDIAYMQGFLDLAAKTRWK